jgi:hypothetical protein
LCVRDDIAAQTGALMSIGNPERVSGDPDVLAFQELGVSLRGFWDDAAAPEGWMAQPFFVQRVIGAVDILVSLLCFSARVGDQEQMVCSSQQGPSVCGMEFRLLIWRACLLPPLHLLQWEAIEKGQGISLSAPGFEVD